MKGDKDLNLPEPSRCGFLEPSAAGAVLTLGAGCGAMEHVQPVASGDGHVTTRDGVRLHYIAIPTLVVGGSASLFNPRSQQWIARQIPGSRVEIFDESEGGSHFMFLENATRFHRLVTEFLG